MVTPSKNFFFLNWVFLVVIALYLVVVVLLVRRQIYQVKGEEEEDRIVMVDKTGNKLGLSCAKLTQIRVS
jgi:hypothetical protein